MTQTKTKSRAVIRPIPAGYEKRCEACGGRIKFNMKDRPRQIICNVYKGNEWKKVEHWHESCWMNAGEPYGPLL